MSGEATINELEKRIAVVRQNVSGVVEQTAALSGAGDEARAADRMPNKSPTPRECRPSRGARVSWSFLLTRLYPPSGDLSGLLTRHQPAIG
jgi:hypothetical protein